ncbi:hypothetical protein pb186bvf_008586 [Paramecium bursaria]
MNLGHQCEFFQILKKILTCSIFKQDSTRFLFSLLNFNLKLYLNQICITFQLCKVLQLQSEFYLFKFIQSFQFTLRKIILCVKFILYMKFLIFNRQILNLQKYQMLSYYGEKLASTLYQTVKAPPTQSTFFQTGQLTAEEFIKAGDKVISNCGSWKWFRAADAKCASQYLPQDKQFLGIENVISNKRLKDLKNQSSIHIVEDDDDSFIVTNQQEQQQIIQEEPEERYYNLYIVYDEYHYTPRLFLSGRDSQSQPLSYIQIKEDIVGDYADKTVTQENMPRLNLQMPTVHPCKHAETLKFLTDQMRENGASQEKIHVDNSILLFLKFFGSVIPTIQFDFAAEVVMG